MLFLNRAKVQTDKERVIEYVRHNVVPAQEGRKCVDGRYLPTQARGMIARPGGDCGYVMALMAVNRKKKLGLTPEQCFNAVYKVVAQGPHGSFCVHTDHQFDPASEHDTVNHHLHQTVIGCGHLMKAASQRLRKPYDVTGKDVKRIVAYVRNIADISDAVQLINLDGNHAEEGVLVIKSDEHTINAHDPQMHRMFFIYDEKRDQEFMKYLVKEMDLPGVTYEDMKNESDKQLTATLHNLAKRLPVYTVDFDGKIPQISYVRNVK